MNQYSYINQKLDYNKGITDKTSKIPDSYSFSMYQSRMTSINNNSTQNQKDTDNTLYCGGDSSLALKSMMDNTPVSIIYFSKRNMNRIQKQLRIEVEKYFNGKMKLLVDQDELDLINIMRFIYLEYGKNLPYDYGKQVKELNIRTIKYIVPDMITNIKQQYDYIRDITSPLKPIDRPINVNHAGRQTLPSLTSPYGF